MPTPDCPFCSIGPEEVVAQDGPCLAVWTNESPTGSLMVIPTRHRRTPWELTTEEWSATQRLLRSMMSRVSELHAPDGWNVGWNVGAVGGQSVDHAHCHLVPRYADEPFAGRGLRWWFKREENSRPAG